MAFVWVLLHHRSQLVPKHSESPVVGSIAICHNTFLAERIPGVRIQTALTSHEELEVKMCSLL